jgi:hypothetical protein
MACASSSLPVPVSPSSSTALSVCATRRAWRLTSSAAGLLPMKLAMVCLGRRCSASWRRALSSSPCSRANFCISGCMVVSGWSSSTMPRAPITSPASLRSGSRLTRKVPAWLLSRSTRMGCPVSMTCAISVLGTTSSTRLPTKSLSLAKPSAGRKFL